MRSCRGGEYNGHIIRFSLDSSNHDGYSMSAPDSLYLIDAYSLIFQVFHALPEMKSASGLPTNALFGITRDIFYLRNQKKPTYLVCCFDESGPTFRDQLFAEYKAQRAPMPDDLQLQIPLIRE